MRGEVYTQRSFLIARTVVLNVPFYAQGNIQRYRFSVIGTCGGENNCRGVFLDGLRRI